MATKRSSKKAARKSGKKWSKRVMETSDALDLENELFTRSPREVALLQRSASKRSKARSHARSDYQAAMSMLTFYVDRAGDNLSAADRERLEAAKDELRKLYGRE